MGDSSAASAGEARRGEALVSRAHERTGTLAYLGCGSGGGSGGLAARGWRDRHKLLLHGCGLAGFGLVRPRGHFVRRRRPAEVSESESTLRRRRRPCTRTRLSRPRPRLAARATATAAAAGALGARRPPPYNGRGLVARQPSSCQQRQTPSTPSTTPSAQEVPGTTRTTPSTNSWSRAAQTAP